MPCKLASPLWLLPEELISEILFRVPVRSLLQFRCVCKSWKTLISHPQFAMHRLRTSIAHPNIAHQQLTSSKLVSYSVHSLLQNSSIPEQGHYYSSTSHKYRILGSCNGLLCLSDINLTHVVLCNPSIRSQSKKFQIMVSPRSCFTYYCFGYDHVNDKYKLLVVVGSFQKSVTKLYTFGADCYCSKVIQNFPCHPTRKPGKFVSGTLNWIAKRDLNNDDQQRMILSFDLATETYGEVLLPDGDHDKICSPTLDVLRVCLCVCFSDYRKGHWIVWLMKEYGVPNSWTKLVTIPYIKLGICRWSHLFVPLCISENGVLLLKTTSSKLVIYNLNDGRMDYLRIVDELGFDIHVYHESLVSPQF